MSHATDSGGMLDPEDLREIDETILSYLREGRVTPAYARKRITTEDGQYTRGYVQQRLARLEEHSHVENMLNVGLYELVHDPIDGEERDESDEETDQARAQREILDRALRELPPDVPGRTAVEDLAAHIEDDRT